MNRYFRRNAKRSWHRFVTFTRTGRIDARCGFKILPGVRDVEWSDEPPLNEKGCESCARLALRDEESPPNDPVDPGPPNDTVPG